MSAVRLRRLLAAALLATAPAGCAGTDALSVLGKAIEHQDAIVKTGAALRKGFAELTPQEEYYIGRAVAARILSDYGVVRDEARTRYLNTLGQVLARVSDRPETYAGWHFLLLDSDEVNAFAAPGGFVFVTRGLFASCSDEEQLAAVLAHEVGHVTLRHGLSAIKQARLTEAFTIIGTTAVKEFSGAELSKLTEAFEGTINDIVNQMVVSGYSRKQEHAADAEAARVAWRAGYDPAGLTAFLDALGRKEAKARKQGFFSTHPPAGDRRSKAAAVIAREKLAGAPEPARTQRFRKHEL